jgi:hypothetical protein
MIVAPELDSICLSSPLNDKGLLYFFGNKDLREAFATT